MKILTVVAVLLFASSSVQAQNLKVPTIVYASASAADWASTGYCLTSNKCREANPLFSWAEPQFGSAGVIAVGAASDVAAVLLLRHLGVKHPKAVKVGLYALSAYRLALAAQNTRRGYQLLHVTP